MEGPEDTEVTVSFANTINAVSAKINGVAMPIISNSIGELTVSIPPGVTDGNIIVLFDTGCVSTHTFDVIDTVIDSCEGTLGATTPTDIIISEVTDATSGSSSLIEIYNGTSNTVDLSEYALRIYNNGNAASTSSSVLSGNLMAGGIFLVSIGTTSCSYNNIGAGINVFFNGVGGINFDQNKSDAIVLEKIAGTNQGEKDIFGVKGNNAWANGLSIGTDGVNFRRKNTSSPLPTTAFNLADWDVVDWTTCGDSNYANIGVFDFSVGAAPSITIQPVTNTTNCDSSINLTLEANEGYVGGQSLEYTWFYLAPNDTNWTEISSDGGPYTGYDQSTLNIDFTNAIDVFGYQYYCQVREDLATCYIASKAVRIYQERAIWNGVSWSSPPSNSKIAIIDVNYNTGIGTNGQDSFEACSLIVNAGAILNVANSTYVRIVNDVMNDGTVMVNTRGAFVQNGIGANAGAYINNGTTQVQKTTATTMLDLGSTHIYTYWSSPVQISDLVTVFPTPTGNRRYLFEAQNYLDEHTVGTSNGIPDDVDDDANVWQKVSGNMKVGRGYAITSSRPLSFPFSEDINFENTGSGGLNTGDIAVKVYRNDLELADINWNLIGNPYASAIDFDRFVLDNADVLEGVAYLWSHASPESASNPGNYVYNYSQDDYAIINGSGGTAGGSQVIPSKFIPSGQGFFVSFKNDGITSTCTSMPVNVVCGDVVFNNDMRIADTSSNQQFFDANDDDLNSQRIWLNLTSDNGVFNQILVAYLKNATDGDDGMSYDAIRNFSSGNASNIYSLIDGDAESKFGIQGKSLNSLRLDEVISIGFKTVIQEATLYTLSIAQLEGVFFRENTVYLRDNLRGEIHNLSESDYVFTSEVGTFNSRFEIGFNIETLSNRYEEISENNLTIIDLKNDKVRFIISEYLELSKIEIIDVLGRKVHQTQGNGFSKVENLSNLNSALYIAQVTLNNGKVLSKKFIKD